MRHRRAKHEGTVFRIRTGKRKRLYAYCSTETEAIVARDRLKERALRLAPVVGIDLTVADYASRWLGG